MPTTSTDVPEVSPDQLRRSLAENQSIHVLDVRPREDFEAWHIPGSRHVGGYEDLKQGTKQVFADRSLPEDSPIVTVCGAGRTSKIAARQLRKQGKDAYSLRGGMRAWTFAWNQARMELPPSETEIVQLRRTGKGCLSYVVGSQNEALVIDPSLSPDLYLEQAERRSWDITGVLDTHIHADHLSRAQRLAEAADARLYLPRQERVEYPHHSLEGGDVLPIGNALLTALRTPGHTPESMTYRLEKKVLFTGDTLFLEGVGRPDLDADQKEGREKARQLYRSLQRLMQHPDDSTVLPGHESAPVPFDDTIVGSSLKTVKQNVDALHWDERHFVETVLDRVPPTPPNHESIIAHNHTGQWPDETDLIDLEAGANRCAVGN